MKLPIELNNLIDSTMLSTDQIKALISWYFLNFLNKEVTQVTMTDGRTSFPLQILSKSVTQATSMKEELKEVNSTLELD